MPEWLQVIYTIIAPILVSVSGWVLVQVWNMRIRMAELEADIQNMQPICSKHEELFDRLNLAISRIDRNIVRLGVSSEVEGIENFNG